MPSWWLDFTITQHSCSKRKGRKLEMHNIHINGGKGFKVINNHEGSNLERTASPSTLPSAVSYLVTV